MKCFASLLIALSLFSAPLCAAEVVERIIAVVNDEIITDRDLDMAMAPVVAQYRAMYSGGELDARLRGARRQFLDKVIEDKLIFSEAKRKQIIVKDIEVDDMAAEIRNKFPNREAYLAAIEEQGLTEKKVWERYREQLMTQKLVNYEVKSKVSVSPGEVTDYYNAHESEFGQPERAHLQQILIRLGSRNDEEAKAFAESLVKEIRSGKSFEDIAKKYSEGTEAKVGGEMGFVEKGQLMGEIDEKVFALQPGGITEPIKSSLGYHIFKVVEKQELAVRPLAEVRNDVQELLFKQKLRERLDGWIANLKKNAYISIR